VPPRDSFAGITVPEGDPGGLSSAGATVSGVAGALAGVAAQLNALPAELSAWKGPASLAFGGEASSLGEGAARVGHALDAFHPALRRAADELEEAQRLAEEAIEEARDAQRRIDEAERRIADARTTGAEARMQAGAAATKVAATGLLGSPSPAAEADRAVAEHAAQQAAAEEAHARRAFEAAREDLERAREKGRKANEQAEDARIALAAASSAMVPGLPFALAASALTTLLSAGAKGMGGALGSLLALFAGGEPRKPGFGEPVPGLDLPIPGPFPPPPPPAPPPYDGSGEYDSESAGLDDWAVWWKLRAVKGGGEIMGETDAARHMDHFLDNSGEPLDIDPGRLLRDMPEFEDEVREELRRTEAETVEQAKAHYRGEPISIPFVRDWRGYGETQTQPMTANWFHAMGGFSYSTSGVVRVSPPATPGGEPQVRIDHQLHIFDRYNWDKGKDVTLPVIGTVPDEDIQPLHRAGIAQEYEIHGSTDTESFTADPSARPPDTEPPPAPDAARSHEGTRADPAR